MAILIVDDDEALSSVLEKGLRVLGEKICTAKGVTEARVCFDRCGISLLITDIVMPDGGGADLIAEVRARFGEDFPIIAMSGGGAALTGADGLNLASAAGAQAVLFKPFSQDELLETVTRFLPDE